MKTRKELEKEIVEREKLEVSEEHTGHWSYDDILRAELTQTNEIIRLIEDEIDSFHKIHIHTAYPSGQTKCSEPKECYLDKRLNKLKRNILTKIKGARK